MPPLASLTRYSDVGLLILRVGIGGMFVGHGLPKLTAGPELWETLGMAMLHLGIDFGHRFWGFSAGLAEFGGGLLLALGLWTRPACVLLAFTMFIASVQHLAGGDSFGRSSHAMESFVLFVSFLLIGPGRFSLDGK